MGTNIIGIGGDRIRSSAPFLAGWHFGVTLLTLTVAVVLFAVIALVGSGVGDSATIDVAALSPAANPGMNVGRWYAPSRATFPADSIAALSPTANPSMNVGRWFAASGATFSAKSITALNPAANPGMNVGRWYAPSGATFSAKSIAALNRAANPGMNVGRWYVPSGVGQAGSSNPELTCSTSTVPCP